MPGQPALYRTTLTIRSAGGRKLAGFGNYYRVVRPTVNVRLTSIAPVYRPGATLYAESRTSAPPSSSPMRNPRSKSSRAKAECRCRNRRASSRRSTSSRRERPAATARSSRSRPRCPGRYRLSQEAVISWPFERRERRPTCAPNSKSPPDLGYGQSWMAMRPTDSGVRGRCWLLALAGVITALAIPGSATAAVTYETPPAFCEPQVVHDFLAPLGRLPRLHSPTSSGQLGFGPASLRIEPLPA